MKKLLTSSDIISEIKGILEIENDKDLADYLDIDKQSIYQYKKKLQVDIQQKIICELIFLCEKNK